jgi:hypothetical protein
MIAAIATAAILATLLAVITGGSIVGAFAGGFSGSATNSFGSLLTGGGIHLAEGGITNGPTRALIGEGGEREAVMPLSKLQSFVNTGGSMNDGHIVGVLQGSDLVLQWHRATIRKGRVG